MTSCALTPAPAMNMAGSYLCVNTFRGSKLVRKEFPLFFGDWRLERDHCRLLCAVEKRPHRSVIINIPVISQVSVIFVLVIQPLLWLSWLLIKESIFCHAWAWYDPCPD